MFPREVLYTIMLCTQNIRLVRTLLERLLSNQHMVSYCLLLNQINFLLQIPVNCFEYNLYNFSYEIMPSLWEMSTKRGKVCIANNSCAANKNVWERR